MVELNRLQAVAEKESQEAVEKFNRSSCPRTCEQRYKVVTAPFTEADAAKREEEAKGGGVEPGSCWRCGGS